MLGAAIGNIIASRFEQDSPKTTKFTLFDHKSSYGTATICTTAIADWIIDGGQQNPAVFLQKWARRYPHPANEYSPYFSGWMWQGNPHPYGSFGSGSAQRVSAIGWTFNTLSETLNFACDSASATHSHTEGIKGAQAVAAAIFWARTGESKHFIRDNTARLFGYDVGKSCKQIRPYYTFHKSCQNTVPQAITAFLESETFEEAIRLSISLGGDRMALTAITGSIAEAYYRGIPPIIRQKTLRILPDDIVEILLQIST